MSRALEIAVLSLGGLCLFAVSFLGFALSAGVPMHEVAVVGSLFPEPEEAEEEGAAEPVAKPEPIPKTDDEVVQDHLALLSLWSIDSPYEADELNELVTRIKARSDDLGRRLDEVEQREQHLEDKSLALSAQHKTLEDLRAELEDYDSELRLREAEVQRDVESTQSREDSQWAETANLFAEGDVGALAGRLQQFTPDEAARILRSLDDTRARELLDALPDEQWKTYAAAYTSARP